MCDNKNISKISFVFFIIMQNYLMYNYFLLPLCIKTNLQTGFIPFIITLVISIIIIIILPKKIGEINYFEIIKRGVVLRYILAISKFIIAVLTMYISVRTLSGAVFGNASPLIFIFSLSIGSIFISMFEANHILNSATLFFIFGLGLILIGMFLNSTVNDYRLLLPLIYDYKFKVLIIVYITLDAISLLFLNNGVTSAVKKIDILIGICIFFTLCIFETINVITLCGTDYLLNNEFLGFFSLYIQDTLTYVGNLSFIYIILIPVVCLFKTGLSIKYIKKLVGTSNNLFFNGSIFLLLTGLLILMSLRPNITNSLFIYLLLAAMIGLSITYVFIMFNRSEKIEVTI